MLGVILREEGDGFSLPPCSPRTADSVDVRDGATREVVVDDEIDALEIHPTTEKLSAYQNPRRSCNEIKLNDLFFVSR